MDARTLLGGLAQGLSGAVQNHQALQEQERKKHMEAAETAFRMGDLDGVQKALGNAGIQIDLTQAKREQAVKQAEGMRSTLGGMVDTNPQEVAAQLPAFYQTMNQATGLNLNAPVIKGGVKPTVNPNVYDRLTEKPMEDWSKPVSDFSNPQTKTRLLQALGVKPQAPEGFDLAPGHSRFTIGPDGKVALSVTAPYQMNPNTVAGIDSRERVAALNNQARMQIRSLADQASWQRLQARLNDPKDPEAKDPLKREQMMLSMAKIMAGPMDPMNDPDGSAWMGRLQSALSELRGTFGGAAPVAPPSPTPPSPVPPYFVGAPGVPTTPPPAIPPSPKAPTPQNIPRPVSITPTPQHTPAAWQGHVSDFTQAFPTAPVTSTTRTPAKNASVGGVTGSYHTKGMAFDAVVPPAQIPQAKVWAAARGMEAIVEDLGKPNYHVHFEPAPQAAPRQQRPSRPSRPSRPTRPMRAQGKPQAQAAKPAPKPVDKATADVIKNLGLIPEED